MFKHFEPIRVLVLTVLTTLISCSGLIDETCPVEYFDLKVYNSTASKFNFAYKIVKQCLAPPVDIGEGNFPLGANETLEKRIGEREPVGFTVVVLDENNVQVAGNSLDITDDGIFSLIITTDGSNYYIDTEEQYNNFVPATIHYTGDLAADGCGWLIDASNVLYSPIWFENNYLEFHEDGLEVLVSYFLLSETFQCGLPLASYPRFEIREIRKR